MNTSQRPSYCDECVDLSAEIDVDLVDSDQHSGTQIAHSAGCGLFIPLYGVTFGVRLRNFASPLTAELFGIFYALENARAEARQDTVIFADSRSALIRIRNRLFNIRATPLPDL